MGKALDQANLGTAARQGLAQTETAHPFVGATAPTTGNVIRFIIIVFVPKGQSPSPPFSRPVPVSGVGATGNRAETKYQPKASPTGLIC
jgi:hypothetical protein